MNINTNVKVCVKKGHRPFIWAVKVEGEGNELHRSDTKYQVKDDQTDYIFEIIDGTHSFYVDCDNIFHYDCFFCKRNNPFLIGVSGKIGSGKDVFVSFLEELGFTKMAFADNLKKIVEILTGVGYTPTREAKEFIPKGFKQSTGQLYQMVGQAMRDTISPEVWITSLFSQISENKEGYVAISDVRYENEADHIREMGGVLIRINRDENLIKDGYRNKSHISETSLDNYNHFDYIIDNNGTPEELKEKIYDVVFNVNKGKLSK